MTPYWFVIVVVIFHLCSHHFHETPCVQHYNVFLKGHAMMYMWGHGCRVSYKMKSAKGITVFITNTIFMRHLDATSEWNIFLPTRFCLSGNLWMNNTCNTNSKSECFYRLQLFTIKIFQKQTTPTVPKLKVHLTVGNTLAWQSQLESWNMSYFHPS